MKLITILPFLFVFIASLYNSADLDLGWHLKYGEYFVKNHQVVKINTFSSEMPNYRYPDTSWASDAILYIIFQKLGFVGITLLGALIVTATFYFFSKAAKLTLFAQSLIFPLLIYLLAPQNAASYRAQLISFLFLGILFYLLTSRLVIARSTERSEGRRSNLIRRKALLILRLLHFVRNDTKLWLIPILFLLWANMHGEYLTGLVLFGMFIILKVTMGLSFRPYIPLIAVFTLSVLATLINPFGINIYLESLRHFNNPLQKYVIEWLPNSVFSRDWWNLVLVGFAQLAGFIILFKKNYLLPTTYYLLPTITFLLLALSFWSRRYAWTFFYFSIFLIAPLIAYLEPHDKKINTQVCSILLTVALLVALLTKLPLTQFTNMNWDIYCLNYVECSPKSVKYLADNHLDKNLYTFYDWGGYIMWNSNIKPSMDGRMALWRDDNGYSAFEKYYALQQNRQDIDASNYNVVLINHKKPLYLHLQDLVKMGKWQIGYQDEIATVFLRKNP